MAAEFRPFGVASEPCAVEVRGEPIRPRDDVGVRVALSTLDDEFAVGEHLGDRVGHLGHRELHHASCFQVCSRPSVVVIVANSDSVLSMTASPYSVGIPATASRGSTTR